MNDEVPVRKVAPGVSGFELRADYAQVMQHPNGTPKPGAEVRRRRASRRWPIERVRALLADCKRLGSTKVGPLYDGINSSQAAKVLRRYGFKPPGRRDRRPPEPPLE